MLPPLVERELQVALLRRKAHTQWMMAAWIAGGITLLSMLVLGLTSNRSSGRTLFHWLLLVWVWILAQRRFGALFRGSPSELAFLGFIIFPLLLTFSRRRVLRQKLTNELRLIACAPIPARGDKRFKTWSPDRIFPPGRWGELVLRPAEPRGRMDTPNG